MPLRKFICITGVSGSGKSSLLHDVLYRNVNKIKSRINEPLEKVSKILGAEYIDKIVMIDQSPIGRSTRSNPATYTGVFTHIRDFYASLPEARERKRIFIPGSLSTLSRLAEGADAKRAKGPVLT